MGWTEWDGMGWEAWIVGDEIDVDVAARDASAGSSECGLDKPILFYQSKLLDQQGAASKVLLRLRFKVGYAHFTRQKQPMK